MATLRYTASAENDLLEAWLSIAENNPAAADRVVEAIDQDAHLLIVQPLMGRERPELTDGLRSWPTSTRYILYYFADASGVVIARVLHHARDIRDVKAWPQGQETR